MPFTSRRSLLATGALLLTGCSADPLGGGAPSGATGRKGPAVEALLRRTATTDSADLLARYEATARAHPGLADRLAEGRAQAAEHGRAFARGAAAATGGSPPAGAPAVVPATEKAALAALAAAERALAARRAEALLGAPGELARLLASVAAAGEARAYLLTHPTTQTKGS
ncbi:hypothetical protein [Streptomyces sp. NPDC060194]|uniref:hypothetical protein n=1 Tax=Streptomyces sp. NPDC060194 TaxID=3347069 RepID=UPI003656D760